MIARAALFALSLALAACGNTGTGPIAALVQTALRPDAPRPSMAEQRAQVLAAVATSGSTESVLLVEIPGLQAVASLVIVGRNGDVLTWQDPSGVGIITEGGVLRGTRGLGFDLIASDIRGTQAALRGGPTTYRKRARSLDGSGMLQDITYACNSTRTGNTLSETCRNTTQAFKNMYTLQGDKVVKARQWVSPEVGYLTLERVQ